MPNSEETRQRIRRLENMINDAETHIMFHDDPGRLVERAVDWLKKALERAKKPRAR